MINVTRRSFLAAAGAIPFAAWLEPQGFAQAASTKIRCDARSPQGIEMLKVYAAAVNKMKDPAQIPTGDPRSWIFQWYTHFVNDATTKAAEIQRIYPNAGDPNRAVAEAMWNTCQAHSPGDNEDFFLPWHRCFVYFFEQIIAYVSGRDDFTLPYWNYSTADQSIRGVIPPQFTMQNDPVFGSLFDGLRNPGVNQGRPIQSGLPGDPLNLAALAETTYSPSGASGGFNQDLDFGLHGNVHVLVGGPNNMGNVPTAAQDPIFWMHHCNIDRLWASWNAAGRTNPPLSQTFTFADRNGKPVVVDIADYLDIGKLGYTYDRFEPVPGAVPQRLLAAAATSQQQVVASSPQGITLGATATQVTLAPAPAALNAAALTVPAQVASVAPEKKVYLVASQLSAKAQPGVLYSTYLDLPANPTPQQLDDHFVGTINFFGIAHSGDGHGQPAAHAGGVNAKSKFVSFEVTGKVRALGKNRFLKDQPVLSIIPEGQPAAAAQPVIGKIELVVQ
jgi:tyrosinase